MKPKHQRLLFILVSIVFLCVGSLLTLSAFRENLIFFYSPSDLQTQITIPQQTIRIGGLVKAGSIKKSENDSVHFIITDGKAEINVSYNGMLPNLFRDGQGCIAEGSMVTSGEFSATKILAKHDEKYMPKEVVDALKRSGEWRSEEAK